MQFHVSHSLSPLLDTPTARNKRTFHCIFVIYFVIFILTNCEFLSSSPPQMAGWRCHARANTSPLFPGPRCWVNLPSSTIASARPPSRPSTTASCGPSSDNASRPSWCAPDWSARPNTRTSWRGACCFTCSFIARIMIIGTALECDIQLMWHPINAPDR